MIFKAIVIGLLAWQLISMVRKRRQKQPQNTYVIIPPENVIRKDPAQLDLLSPPSYYSVSGDTKLPGLKQ